MTRASYLIAFALSCGAMPLAANADNAYTLRDVEVYTGPGSEYPPVATLPPNMGVDVAGCLSDWSWCDVIFADNRGWVYAGDLGYPYQGNRVAIIEYGPRLHVPVVAFSLPAYWDAHYRNRPFYRERDVWVNRVHAQVDRGGRPPEGRSARGAPPGGSVTTAPQGQTSQPAPQPQPQGTPPQYTTPRQPADTMQRPNASATSQPQPSQMTPQQNSAVPSARAREGTPPSPQSTTPTQPQSSTPTTPSTSMQSGRGPEARPPEGRPPEGRPSEGRPVAGSPPGSQGPRDAGPPSDRGQREGQGQSPGQGRGEGSPDRDRQ